jgi:hypothetical protein
MASNIPTPDHYEKMSDAERHAVHVEMEVEARLAARDKSPASKGYVSQFVDQMADAVLDTIKGVGDRLAGRIKKLETEIVELKSKIADLEAREPVISDKGVWRSGTVYEPGDLVTYKGAGWVCRGHHLATGTTIDHASFRLFQKSERTHR